MLWVLPDRLVHVEVDEDSHVDRETACELKKLDSANWGMAEPGHYHRPTALVRFNCSSYDGRDVSLDERVRALAAEIVALIEEPLTQWDSLRINVIFMYYHSSAKHHIKAARKASGAVNVVKVVS